MKKYKNKTLKIIAKSLILTLILVFSVNFTLAFVNYNHNKNQQLTTENGLILKQGALKNFKLGVETANKNSCGVIATYNFLKLNNENPDFNRLLRFYDAYGTNLFGVLGVNPFVIQGLLRMKGYNAEVTINKQQMHNLAKNSDTSILLYFHSYGAHYITLKYNQENDNFFTYNEKYGKVEELSLSEVFSLNQKGDWLALLIYIK